MTHCEQISGSTVGPRSGVTQTVTTQTALLLWVNSPQSLEAEGHVFQSFSSWLLDFVLKLIHKKQCQLLEGYMSVQKLSSMFSLLDSGWGRECRGGEKRKRDPHANKGPSCCFISAHSLLSKSCMLEEERKVGRKTPGNPVWLGVCMIAGSLRWQGGPTGKRPSCQAWWV